MKTLESLQAKIAELQAEAESLMSRERGSVLARIIEGMQSYKITLPELREAMKAKPGGAVVIMPAEGAPPDNRKKPMSEETRAKLRAAMKAKQDRVKYRNDKGEVWSGLGYPPRWISEWESKRGRSREKWLVM